MKLTGITVSYNTQKLLERALKSIWQFYPDLKIIVIDGSLKNDPCYKYVAGLPCQTVQFGYNIGHGAGIQIGIALSPTDYILIFDSDVKIHKPPLEAMMEKFEEDTFGVGEIVPVKQEEYAIHLEREGAIPVLHPYFQIINRREYYRYMPYAQSGGPNCLTMINIFNRRLSGKVLKNFPVKDYVEHNGRGTRKLRKRKNYQMTVPANIKLSDYFL